MTHDTGIIEIQGIKTYIKIHPGNGTPIVCIHGNSHSHNVFSPLWDKDKYFDNPLIAYDLPGHGQTSPPGNPETGYSLPGYAEHLEALISALELDQVILLGFSMGGHIALEAAGNHLKNKVKGLFTIGTPPIGSIRDMSEAFQVFPGGFNLFSEILTDEQISIISGNITNQKDMMRMFKKEIENTDCKSRKYLLESLVMHDMYHSEHKFLRSTDIPVKIAFGEYDRMISMSYVGKSEIQILLGDRLIILRNCSHLPDWAENKDFKHEFSSFLMETHEYMAQMKESPPVVPAGKKD